jgi:ankyrin repeat protein
MKIPLTFVALLWVSISPLCAQAQPATVTPEAVLIELAFNGNLAGVQKLVEAGMPVDSVNPDKSTSLEHGAKVDAKDANGRTALIYASSGPFAETVELLLNNGAEVNLQGSAEGFTALMMAAAEGHVEVVRLLLAHDARADILDRDGDTAEKFARERGQTEVLKLLGAKPADRDPP